MNQAHPQYKRDIDIPSVPALDDADIAAAAELYFLANLEARPGEIYQFLVRSDTEPGGPPRGFFDEKLKYATKEVKNVILLKAKNRANKMQEEREPMLDQSGDEEEIDDDESGGESETRFSGQGEDLGRPQTSLPTGPYPSPAPSHPSASMGAFEIELQGECRNVQLLADDRSQRPDGFANAWMPVLRMLNRNRTVQATLTPGTPIQPEIRRHGFVSQEAPRPNRRHTMKYLAYTILNRVPKLEMKYIYQLFLVLEPDADEKKQSLRSCLLKRDFVHVDADNNRIAKGNKKAHGFYRLATLQEYQE